MSRTSSMHVMHDVRLGHSTAHAPPHIPSGSPLRPSEVVQRVRDRAVDPHLEVQVRAEAQPGAAGVADDLALRDARPERGREARLVRVARRQRRAVRDARVVAVAAGRADRLHERDLARRGGADRRAARDADVDARVARLPRAALAERRRDRPVYRPDHPARAALDRARRQRPGRPRERALDLRLLGPQARERALEVLALAAHLHERAALVGARAVETDARVDEILLERGDLVAVGKHDRGDAALAALEALQARGGRGRVGPGGADERDDPLVLLGDALHELALLEQVGEPVAVQDHRGDVGVVGLVELNEPLPQRAPRLAEPRAQPDEPPALVAQLALELRQLRTLAVEIGLDLCLVALEAADA